MNSSKKGFLSTFKTNVSLREPEISRLQRELESLTCKLERERRDSANLDEQIQTAENNLREKNGKTQQKQRLFPGKTLKDKVKKLERKLGVELHQFNEVTVENQKLKSLIEELRRDRMHYKRNINNFKEETMKCSIRADKQHQEYRRGSESVDRQSTQIKMIRSRSVLVRNKLGNRITELNSVLRDEKRLKRDLDPINADWAINQTGISKILGGLLIRWKRICKEKRRACEYYIKNIQILESAFENIKEATGMASIDEIVTAFIKSEEQNYELCKYMNNLSSEIDQLEDHLKHTKDYINMCENSKENKEQKGFEFRSSLEKRLIDIKRKIILKSEKIGNFKQNTNGLIGITKKILELCQKTALNIRVPKLVNIDEIDAFNEEVSTILLGEIEEYINCILILKAYDENEENVALKTIPLDMLKEKSFGSPSINVNSFFLTSDLYDDPTIEETRYPMTTSDLKLKAKTLYDTFDKTPSSSNHFKFD